MWPDLFLKFILFVCFNQQITAQTVKNKLPPQLSASLQVERKITDSLVQLFLKDNNDTSRMKLAGMLAPHMLHFSFDSAIYFSEVLKTLALQTGNKKAFIKSYVFEGFVKQSVYKDWRQAKVFYTEAAKIAEKNGLYQELHDTYSAIINCYFYLGDYPNAMQTVVKALASAEQKNDLNLIFLYNNLMADINVRQQNYSVAMSIYQRLWQTALESKNEQQLFYIYLGSADIYIAGRDSAHAFTNLKKAHQLAVKLFDHYNHMYRHKVAFVYYKLGYASKVFGDLKQAMNHTRMALHYTTIAACDKFDIANYYLQAGDIYRLQKQYRLAKQNLFTGLSIANEIKHKEDGRDAYFFLSETYAAEKKYDSAFFYNRFYNSVRDSIVNERSQYMVEEVKHRFDVEKKDQEIQRQQKLRTAIIIVFCFLILCFSFLYYRYRLQQKHHFQQQLNEQKKEMLTAMIKLQDSERKRIAQDLHDTLGSVLSAAKLKLSALDPQQRMANSSSADAFYHSALSLLDEASDELRNISHNIMPASLSKLGLVAAIKNLTDNVSMQGGLQIQFTSHGFLSRLNEEVEISIYRIVLELINNIVKHADATNATVQLIRYPERINITVEDNGKGFNIGQSVTQRQGMGLGNVYSRVEMLKAVIEIDSAENSGTTVVIDIPV